MTLYMAWCPDLCETIDDGRRIEERDHEEAANEWARISDWTSGEFIIGAGGTAVVHVQEIGDRTTYVFRVTGRAEPVYSAELITGGEQ